MPARFFLLPETPFLGEVLFTDFLQCLLTAARTLSWIAVYRLRDLFLADKRLRSREGGLDFRQYTRSG